MKSFTLIQQSNTESTCQQCRWFRNDPSFIEETYPGLRTMSSGFASVLDRDGFCNFHQIYLSARDSCPKFVRCQSEEE
ncbi:MAG TPA: hypothetical protein VMI35_04990 [Puia sp.]|nr:hypothetical protein [Puia sp.]